MVYKRSADFVWNACHSSKIRVSGRVDEYICFNTQNELTLEQVINKTNELNFTIQTKKLDFKLYLFDGTSKNNINNEEKINSL